VSGLGAAGWDVSDVKAILITHGHGDHMGLARRLRELSGAWVAMHEADTSTGDRYADHDDFNRASDEAPGWPDRAAQARQPRPGGSGPARYRHPQRAASTTVSRIPC
jgi:glyoxylase-like metal-dependent hydrolase (beta-lactamase superfamily II)